MPAWIVPAALAVGQLITGLIGQHRQNKYEKGLAKYQADMNQKYLEAQLEYNTPKSQMSRFSAAGLNPNLIYGQGSPGNQSAPLEYPQQRSVDMQSAFQQLLPSFNQSMLAQSQVAATDARTQETFVTTEVKKLQARVLEANPALNEAGFNAMIENLILSAKIKATQLEMGTSQLFVQQATAGHQVNKIFQEVQLLEARYKLAGADQSIRAQVLQSKEFQNDLLEIQKKWMSDGEITPQHIYQFIQILLMKLF